MESQSGSICKHTVLKLESSSNAAQVGYRRPTEEQRAAATTRQGTIASLRGKRKRDADLNAATPPPASFPALLVLPGDDLSLDPSYPPQSLRSWVREKERNKVTSERNTVYVAASPEVTPDVEHLCELSRPKEESCGSFKAQSRLPPALQGTPGSRKNFEKIQSVGVPCVEDVKDYLAAFYHGMPVKLLPPPKLSFTAWNNGKFKSSKAKKSLAEPRFIGLNAFSNCTRIRIRPTANAAFPCQLNLNDLLDAAISMLPDDAYALLLLVNHDLYEDDEDEFVCGRAYGGSRVAVISTARYDPELDEKHNVEREHSWPASHCNAYMQSCCDEESASTARPRRKAKAQSSDCNQPSLLSSFTTNLTLQLSLSPYQAALSAYNTLPAPSSSSPSLWLSRVCRTASHELGHCFGIDHCVYYACSMQGSGSLAEDARQPPYLCPVDLAKVLQATGGDARGRYGELLAFCERHADGHLFSAFAAWIRTRLVEMKTPV